MSVNVNVDSAGVEAWLREGATRNAEALRLFQDEGSQIVMEEMRGQVPFRTGFLRESIGTAYSPDGFVVSPNAPYAPYVDQGTAPHVIFPARARALRFETGMGVPVFARRVKHPGSRGRFFIQRTSELVRDRLVAAFNDILERVHS